jgi:hypothetical protein
MIPAVLGLTAWIAKGVALAAVPRLLKAVTDISTMLSMSLNPIARQAVLDDLVPLNRSRGFAVVGESPPNESRCRQRIFTTLGYSIAKHQGRPK